MKTKDIKNIIDGSLGLKKENLNEAYSKQIKNWDFRIVDILSKKALDAHYELYKNYVSKMNRASIASASLDAKNPDNYNKIRKLRLEEQYNMSAAMLHECFFDSLGATSNSTLHQDSITYTSLARQWGDFDAWQRDFIACAEASPSASWAVLVCNLYTGEYSNMVLNDHNIGGIAGNCLVLICLDLFEHSYWKNYMTEKKNYIFNCLLAQRWDVIEKRFEKAQEIKNIWKSY